MKGGGLTWVGWLMVGVGGMLVYAGMTGQSLVDELSAVLNGRSIPKGPGPAYQPGGSVYDSQVPVTLPAAKADPDAAAKAAAASRSVPWPVYV